MKSILQNIFITALISWCNCSLSFGQETTNAYFGNIHQHTGYSFDAFEGAHRHQPNKTYKYAKGDTINYEGSPLQLPRPLDFLAITDHAEYLGVFPYYDKHAPNHVAHKYREKEDGSKALSHWQWVRVFFSMYSHNAVEDFQNEAITKKAWQHLIDLAEKHYEPGTFTTLAGFEWTAMTSGFLHAKDRHRCVIFRSTEDLPDKPYSQLESNDPEDLWDWLNDYRQQSGDEVIAIPHNMNRSAGMSFSTDSRNNGEPFDSAYSQERIDNEMLQEVAQRKGQSMEHPDVSPEDKFANFEIREELLSFLPIKVKRKNLPTSYARQGLKMGLTLDNELGVNPFAFGVIGSTDSHDGLPFREEMEEEGLNILSKGVAGVWAKENTREAIFDALKRRETFATSGTRLKVRFFGGWEYPNSVDFTSDAWVRTGYQKGVPMGSSLPSKPAANDSPQFLIRATKDTQGANLERIQVVKLWADDDNQTHQKIYNVAWAGNRELDKEGDLPRLVGTDDIAKDNYHHHRAGSETLHAIWQDPDFDASQRSAYYVRVLEVPDMFKGEKDRAWASPIWYGDEQQLSQAETER